MVSTAARANTTPRVHRRYGLGFMLSTDTHDTGFPALAFRKFVNGHRLRLARIMRTRTLDVRSGTALHQPYLAPNVATSNSVLSEIMPSTPKSASRIIDSFLLMVHANIFFPAECKSAINAGLISRSCRITYSAGNSRQLLNCFRVSQIMPSGTDSLRFLRSTSTAGRNEETT